MSTRDNILTERSDPGEIREAVRAAYATSALEAQEESIGACCGPDCGCGSGCCETHGSIADSLYGPVDLPAGVVKASWGCGNPTLLADLRPGQVVLDLGSGGGLDALLSARRVGPTGKVYGLDMTDEMLALARRNAQEAGATNVQFLKGPMESVPLPERSVDVIISNCVVNLSPEKDRVFREMRRVLRPGGRLAIADIIAQAPVSQRVRADVDAWTGCVAGALDESVYVAMLRDAGFVDVGIELLSTAAAANGVDGACCTGGACPGAEGGLAAVNVVSAFIRARAPE